jgi:hypothetical protein
MLDSGGARDSNFAFDAFRGTIRERVQANEPATLETSLLRFSCRGIRPLIVEQGNPKETFLVLPKIIIFCFESFRCLTVAWLITCK